MKLEKYRSPVYGTQGGGLARRVGNTLVFVEPPGGFADLTVGSEVPEQWDFQPTNEAAREECFGGNEGRE